MSTNDGHRGDAYKPALMTLAEIAELYKVSVGRMRSARKHMNNHPKPLPIRIRKTDYFHAHKIHDYIANGNPVGDLQDTEAKLRKGYYADVKKKTKTAVVKHRRNASISMQSVNVARLW